MLDSSTLREWPSTNNPSAGTWSPIFRYTTSPTTISNMEIGCLRPSRTTSTLMLPLTFESFRNCLPCLKLLRAETMTTRKMAMIILPPSYQPSSRPCCLIPNPKERTAHTMRMIMIMSLNASSTKLRKVFGGGLLYLFAPKIFVRCTRSFSSPLKPFSRFVMRIEASCLMPPS
ncbi:hypothetical protein BT93_H2855 [Corymbia citriodora subsp. variegata]|nr:hypothetical protein BT93_H2855 [Corymbia citriodora subsp. variegata]